MRMVEWRSHVQLAGLGVALVIALACTPDSNPDPPPDSTPEYSTERPPPATGRNATPAPTTHANAGEIVHIGGQRARAQASSTLPDQGPFDYGVQQAFDSDWQTAWVEGVEGNGKGEALRITFEKEVVLDGFVLVPGYVKSREAFLQNSVPREITVRFDGARIGEYVIPYALDRVMQPAPPRSSYPGCYPTGRAVNRESWRLVIFPEPIRGRELTMEVTTALSGTRYADLAVTEWRPLLAGAEVDDVFASDAWTALRALRTPDALGAHLAAAAQVDDLREKHVLAHPAVDEPVFHDAPYRQGAYRTVPRVPEAERAPGDAVSVRYLRYVHDALIDAMITVWAPETEATTYVIGAMAARYDDDIGVALYPWLEIDASGRITRMTERYHRFLPEQPCVYAIPRMSDQGQ